MLNLDFLPLFISFICSQYKDMQYISTNPSCDGESLLQLGD